MISGLHLSNRNVFFCVVRDLGAEVITLSDQIPLALEIEASGGVSTFEFGALRIIDLKIRADSGLTGISLPDREGHTTVYIEAKTAVLTILVQEDLAALIYHRGETDTASVEIDLLRVPVTEDGQACRSENYESALKRVDIRLDHSMSSVRII